MAANNFSCSDEEIPRSVFVSKIAPKASVQKVTEFFSFCGKITSLRMRPSPGGETQEAIVVFELPSSAKTALLLKDALIEGIPIDVVPESERIHDQHHDPEVQNANLEGQRYENQGDQYRTSTSVIASMLASGYTLGNQSLQSAVKFDQDYQLSTKANTVIQSVASTASQIDEKYGISATAFNFIRSASTTLSPYVEQAAAAAAPVVTSATTAASNAAHNAMENPTVKSYYDSVEHSMVNLQHSVLQTKADIEEETKRRIAEEQMASHGPVLVPDGEGEKADSVGEDDVIMEGVDGHPQGQPPVGDGKQEDFLL